LVFVVEFELFVTVFVVVVALVMLTTLRLGLLLLSGVGAVADVEIEVAADSIAEYLTFSAYQTGSLPFTQVYTASMAPYWVGVLSNGCCHGPRKKGKEDGVRDGVKKSLMEDIIVSMVYCADDESLPLAPP